MRIAFYLCLLSSVCLTFPRVESKSYISSLYVSNFVRATSNFTSGMGTAFPLGCKAVRTLSGVGIFILSFDIFSNIVSILQYYYIWLVFIHVYCILRQGARVSGWLTKNKWIPGTDIYVCGMYMVIVLNILLLILIIIINLHDFGVANGIMTV